MGTLTIIIKNDDHSLSWQLDIHAIISRAQFNGKGLITFADKIINNRDIDAKLVILVAGGEGEELIKYCTVVSRSYITQRNFIFLVNLQSQY